MNFLHKTTLQVHHILPESCSNGPGLRYTVWVQGCSIQCPDCGNKDTWDYRAGTPTNIGTIIAALKDALNKPEKGRELQGVTITGGEPLDQYKAIYRLCRELFPITSVFLTTGYTPSEIILRGQLGLLDYLDLLCVGPFVKSEACSNQWKGSSNQRLIYLTDRGKALSKLPIVPKEVFINSDGSTIETGFTA